MTPILLSRFHRCAPGDSLVLTAVARDIATAYPNEYAIGIHTTAKDLWRHNPYLDPDVRIGRSGIKLLNMEYGSGIKAARHATQHYIAHAHTKFHELTGRALPVQRPHGDVHFTADESGSLINSRYWVIFAGGKTDFPTKVWELDKFQQVADLLTARGIAVVQAGGTDRTHWNASLTGTLNLVGKTDLRDTARLVRDADGVICAVSFPMHLAAALQRPCVVLGGGREPWYWEAYVRENRGLGCPERLRVPHRFLHTIGLLDCCQHSGCWKNKLTAGIDTSVCKQPIQQPGQLVPKCLDLISADMVAAAALSYYADGTLPPLDQPRMPYTDPSYPPIQPATRIVLPPPTQQAAAPVLTRSPNGRKSTSTPAGLQVVREAPTSDTSIFDHPLIGGRFTTFVLLYGNYPDIHRQCLDALLTTLPPDRCDLRLGSNELCAESVQYIEELQATGRVSLHYRNATNRKKYPVMREMFRDPEHPITTPWLLWLDDDTLVNQDPRWAEKLAQSIVANFDRPERYRMWGRKLLSHFNASQIAWVRQASWFRGRPLRDTGGRPTPSGNCTHFAVGAFWAAHVPSLLAADIPDVRIGHNGGDIMIGEQLWQQGFNVYPWMKGKELVNWSAHERRGLNEKLAGR